MDLQALLSLHGLFSLIILSLLELVLGVDNIIFISLILTKIPEEKRFTTRVTALTLAFLMRIIMLLCLVWLSSITTTLFAISDFDISIRDVLFFLGGAYLVFNTVKEIAAHLRPKEKANSSLPVQKNSYILLQIVVADVLFSFDSIFTAIGLIPNFIIMALAVGIGMICMVYLSGQTSKFIEKHHSIKTLALFFIILVGLMLITEALHWEVPKNYLYGIFIAVLAVVGISTKLKKA